MFPVNVQTKNKAIHLKPSSLNNCEIGAFRDKDGAAETMTTCSTTYSHLFDFLSRQNKNNLHLLLKSINILILSFFSFTGGTNGNTLYKRLFTGLTAQL